MLIAQVYFFDAGYTFSKKAMILGRIWQRRCLDWISILNVASALPYSMRRELLVAHKHIIVCVGANVVKKGKGSFYIAQYPVRWTAQSTF